MNAAPVRVRHTGSRRESTRPRTQQRVSARWVGPLARVHELQHSLGNQATARVLRAAATDSGGAAQSAAGVDERDLQSPRFAGDPVLEACLDGKRVLKAGDSGAAVAKIQLALIDAGFPLPRFGADGKFGPETKDGVRNFQIASELTGRDVDGIVGPMTMGLLDARFPGAAPQPAACQNGNINEASDPLPAVPPFTFTTMSAPEVLEEVRRTQPAGVPMPAAPPLGASQPSFPVNAVTVTARDVPGSPCKKCVADWDVPAAFRVLIAVGSFTDEPKRFAAIRQGDESGCPSSPLPRLLEVRKAILPEAFPFILAGELEHYLDFVRAFRIAAGRYLGNVRRLTPDRTHILGRDQDECEDKVERFLMEMAGHPFFIKGAFLTLYTQVFAEDFETLYTSPNRDGSGSHSAVSRPPGGQRPIFPNIDLDKNPFGCNAFARTFDRRSFPGIPGASSDTAVVDTNVPPRRPWHVL